MSKGQSNAESRPPRLKSARLLIRQFDYHDASFVVELLNDREFINHIQDRGVRTLQQARDYLDGGPLGSYAQYGHGLCCVVEESSQQKIGMCGLLQRNTLPVPDIGYAFLPGARGKGYAFEAATEVIHYARSQMALKRIMAVTGETNTASIGLLTKLGFRYLEHAQFEPDSERVPCYELQLTDDRTS